MVSLEIGGKRVSMNIAQQLVYGSRNIDKMKVEVREAVLILMGLLKTAPGPCSVLVINEKYQFPTTVWKINARINLVNDIEGLFGSKNKFVVECYLKLGGQLITVFSLSSSKNLYFPTDSTQDVYESLPSFVETMYNDYGLKNRGAALIKAAQVQM